MTTKTFPKSILCRTRLAYDDAVSRGVIPDGSICYIEDTRQIVVNSKIYGGGIDAEMSDISENAVQNKVVKSYIDGIVGDIGTILDIINGEIINGDNI